MNNFLLVNDFVIPGVIIVAQILAVLMPVLISVAFLVYAERKVLALIQLRRGPNVVGPFGILQSFADALKLLTKENIVPTNSNKIVFLLAPIITMVISLAGWAVIPFAPSWVIADINVGIMYLFAVSSLGVYGIIMAGWASNSQYPFLGALRSAAQMVSYEVSIGFVIITVLLCVGLAIIDVTTGKSMVHEMYSTKNDDKYSLDETVRFINTYNPSEILLYVPDDIADFDFFSTFW